MTVVSNGSGMPGVEEEEGVTGDETDTTPPVDSQAKKEEPSEDSRNIKEEEEEVATDTSTSADTSASRVSSRILGSKIMWACKLSCVLLTIIIVVQSRGPLMKKTPSPQPFFPRHSLVSDFYTGDIVGLTERLLAADLSLVVYYAPWDRDSQLIRWEVEKAARYHHEQIYFAAVNCWHPQSECKTRYKIRTFPAIVLHVRSVSGMETKAIAYGGSQDAGHIIRFLRRALQPLSHVASHSDLAKLQMEHSVVVLGYFDFTSVSHLPKGFNSYFLASLRALQHDKTNSVAWGVVTNPRAATALSFSITQSVHLVLWNTTLVFTSAASSDSEAISNWVFKRLDETAMWLDVPGTKSLTLDHILQSGPALILFTPDNPYHASNDPFTVLREISLDYYNCDHSSRVSNLARYLGSVRSRGRGQLRQAERVCRNYLQDQLRVLHMSRQQLNLKDETCCRSMPTNEAGTATAEGQRKVCDVCVHPTNKPSSPEEEQCTNPISWEEESNLLQHVNSLMTVFSDSCRELVLQYSPWEHYSVCCQRNSTPAKGKTTHTQNTEEQKEEFKSVEIAVGDDRIEKLVVLAAEDQCKRLFHGALLAPPALLKDQHPAPDVTGLGCKTNRTLSFVALDTLHHKDVAERLGVNLTTKDLSNTAAVIVDLQKESHFIMDASLSKMTLANFIINYTHGLLDRTMVTGAKHVKNCGSSQICIQELTSENYITVTQQTGKMVVVLHYSHNCAACSSVGHVFMTVAHMVRHIPNITFARINAPINTLPWHLYFETLPTIIVHPHYRKSESRVFDLSHPLTPANLMSFLVANLDPTHRLALALSACQDDCREQVVQAATVITTRLHHEITTTTGRFQKILDRLVKMTEEDKMLTDSTHWEVHYHLLIHTKFRLAKEIKKQRSRLHHLGQIQKVLSEPPEKKGLPNPSELLKSLRYILQRSSNSKGKPVDPSAYHDEL
ncbi:thioredoxin domain-containing protein 11-like isoform X2 [Homarus americanus]|uniref:thioredoxin domain-containing protein 11-like isoform X2 n=1 Tax=Homarus americanus TaxID=6706 RepID=UPI001C45B639|nr:thioredoxin domain-containing protein 11-like isoform X2 [Homarus americanus]